MLKICFSVMQLKEMLFFLFQEVACYFWQHYSSVACKTTAQLQVLLCFLQYSTGTWFFILSRSMLWWFFTTERDIYIVDLKDDPCSFMTTVDYLIYESWVWLTNFVVILDAGRFLQKLCWRLRSVWYCRRCHLILRLIEEIILY